MKRSGAKNTDREIWRKVPGDYYSPSIHVTEGGGIGIDVGGFVIVKPVKWWHELAKRELAMSDPCNREAGTYPRDKIR